MDGERPGDPISILIADDHPVVRTGIRGMLAGEPDFAVVGEAGDGAEAVALAERLAPRVVLMDLRMPGTDGVAATAALAERVPAARVLILTTYDSDADILRAIEAGATGYVLKDSPRDEVFRAIRAAAVGKALLAPEIAQRLMDRMRAPASESLSERELAILRLVAHGATNAAIARELRVSQATVKTHLIHAFKKLGVADRTSAVIALLKRGDLSLDDVATKD